jgi:exopolyphosphatase
MSPSRPPLSTFLKNARAGLSHALQSSNRLTFVIGNTSADLDSITSALILSYLRTAAPPRSAFSTPYIPLLNLSRADLSLRPELLALLPHADVQPDQLLTLDDLPASPDEDDGKKLAQRMPPENTKWILVDHNALQGPLGQVYSGRVGGVIDHHEEEGKVPEDTGEEPRIVQVCGSCTSLVVGFGRKAWDEASRQGNEDEEELARIDGQVAKLALASILVDTTNLQSEDKTTSHDHEAVEFLLEKISKTDTDFNREKFFKEIDAAKRDIGSLSLRDILRKDYKEWDCESNIRLGISSVVKDVAFLKCKAEKEADETQKDASAALVHTTATFAEERSLQIHATMTTSTTEDGEFQRELLLWTTGTRGRRIAEHFEKTCSEKLGLEEINEGDGTIGDGDKLEGSFVKLWNQRRTEHSRKQVAPLLRQAATEAKL